MDSEIAKFKLRENEEYGPICLDRGFYSGFWIWDNIRKKPAQFFEFNLYYETIIYDGVNFRISDKLSEEDVDLSVY